MDRRWEVRLTWKGHGAVKVVCGVPNRVNLGIGNREYCALALHRILTKWDRVVLPMEASGIRLHKGVRCISLGL